MAGHARRKRSADVKSQRPSKKQRRLQEYNSDDESNREGNQVGVAQPPDSDDDIHNANLDDAAEDSKDDDSSSSDADASDRLKSTKALMAKARPKDYTKPAAKSRPAIEKEDDEDDSGEEEEEGGDSGDDEDAESDDADDDDGVPSQSTGRTKSKRNDPSAFATSLSKILSTKLSSSKRSDPVLSRSVEAHQASKAAIDGALDAKARRHLKEQKRRAKDKGRIRDVLHDTSGAGPETSAAELLQTERELRQAAKRGVIKMFNAVRAAQVKAAEAEREAKTAGLIGSKQRGDKVSELSKKQFLDLIASGGGGLKKGGLEEA